jgi:hypothetical protein
MAGEANEHISVGLLHPDTSTGSQGLEKPPAASRRRSAMESAVKSLREHALPLLITFIAVLIGQIAVFVQTPKANFTNDTPSYVTAAWNIAQSPTGLVQAFRPPGYPLFIYLVLALKGAPNYAKAAACYIPGTQGACTQQLNVIVLAQGVVAVIAALELYLLVWRLSHRRWTACFATVLIALNIYFGSWERMVLSEFLSYWIILTVFVAFESLVRRPSIWRACLFALVCFAAVMIRPFNIYLPLVLLVLLGLWYIWTRQLWAHALQLLSAVAVLSACVVGYMVLDAHYNGYSSISWGSNATLFGKVIEYHMEYYPVPKPYQDLQTKLDVWVNTIPNPDPWTFSDSNGLDYRETGFRLAGGYAQYVILHHPLTFLKDSIPDILRAWINPGQLYSQYGHSSAGGIPPTEPDWVDVVGFTSYPEINGAVSGYYNPGWITVLLALSTIENYCFLLLPVIILLTALQLWRRPRSGEQFVMLCMGLAAVGGLLMGAMGNYAEFYRTRFPIDWAVIALAAIWLVEICVALSRQNAPQAQPASPRGHELLPRWEDAVWPELPKDPTTITTLPVSVVRVAAPGIQASEPDISALSTLSLPVVEVNNTDLLEISIVLPCLNEEDAIGGCIDTLRYIIWEQRLSAEIIVVDNASTDRSNEIARAHGARVVYQAERGYGNAYLKGFAEARGKYIVMADADNTYDLTEVNEFVDPLRRGYDLVIGNRFAGRMAKGAMTFSHRYIGNPILSGILRLFFHTTVRDAHCGMRAFTRASYPKMRLRTGGMEFASEMVINAAKSGLRITERPISYAPRIGESKLHTVRDGWRHLRFMLLYSPSHLFLLPGLLLLVLGLSVEVILFPGPVHISRVTFDVHTMMLGSVAALLGVQIIIIGLFARYFSLTEELDGEQDQVLQFLTRTFTLERGLMAGIAVFVLGFVVDAYVLVSWIANGMGPLALIRPTVVASTLLAIGAEIVFGSFFLSFLQFRKSLHAPNSPKNDRPSTDVPG